VKRSAGTRYESSLFWPPASTRRTLGLLEVCARRAARAQPEGPAGRCQWVTGMGKWKRTSHDDKLVFRRHLAQSKFYIGANKFACAELEGGRIFGEGLDRK
jgi:hypothetical protein